MRRRAGGRRPTSLSLSAACVAASRGTTCLEEGLPAKELFPQSARRLNARRWASLGTGRKAKKIKSESMKKQQSIEDRIANLHEFRELWAGLADLVEKVAESGNIAPSDEATYQEYIANIARMLPRVQTDVQKHGLRVSKLVPAGGGLYRNVDHYIPFLNIATTAPSLGDIFRHRTGVWEFFDDWSLGNRILLYSIGTLEFAQKLGGEENLPVQQDSPAVFVEVLSAIRRALRPAFKTPPGNEQEVQNQVEVILRAQGIAFERESQIAHATKKVKPDFVLPALDTALEVKLCKSAEREKQIIEEIGADIVAYRKQYPIMLFVVYDVATIADKESFVKGFSGESGILVEIIS